MLYYFKLNILFITVDILFNYLFEVFIRKTVCLGFDKKKKRTPKLDNILIIFTHKTI